MIYKTVDLCAGIGGIRKGFELTGYYKNILSAENNKYAVLTYKHLYNEDPEHDITTEKFKNTIKSLKYDILLAGFPCQAFSRAGQQLGFLDTTRGTLFFDIARIIDETRPKAFLLENVDNLLTHDKGKTFETIIKILTSELDYKIIGTVQKNNELIYERKSFIRNSKNFGVPQNRPRIYLMGFDKRKYGNALNKLENSLPNQGSKIIYKDLNHVIELNAEEKYYLSSGYLETLKKHKKRHASKGNGFGYQIVNDDDFKNPISNALLATGGSGKERNLIIDKQNNISGKAVKNKKTPLNNDYIRVMTPREWGKLQGFVSYAFLDSNGNDLFSFPKEISNTQQYKQFGNAVTIPVIEEMAKFMKCCFDSLEKK